MFQNCAGELQKNLVSSSESSNSSNDTTEDNISPVEPDQPIVTPEPVFTADFDPNPTPNPEPSLKAGERVFYVDSLLGNDSFNGLSMSTPFRSIVAINRLSLKPGDRVYFKRGQTFSGIKLYLEDSGSNENPIVFGAYGNGTLPVLDGNGIFDYGIQAIDIDHIQIRDLHIRNFLKQGVSLRRAIDWQFYNVMIENTGSEGFEGGFRCYEVPVPGGDGFPACKNVRFFNVTVQNTFGDGIVIHYSEQIVVAYSRVVRSKGSTADNLHINYSRDLDIVGNFLSMADSIDSTKGNICICTTYPSKVFKYNRVKNNILEAGNFGISVAGENVLIIGNDFIGHNKETWAAGVLTAEMIDTKNIIIEKNLFHSGSFAVNISNNYSEIYTRSGYRIVGNEIISPARAAITVKNAINVIAAGDVEFNSLYSPVGAPLFMNQSQLTERFNTVSITKAPDIQFLSLPNAGISP